jgi:hypothetical protein
MVKNEALKGRYSLSPTHSARRTLPHDVPTIDEALPENSAAGGAPPAARCIEPPCRPEARSLKRHRNRPATQTVGRPLASSSVRNSSSLPRQLRQGCGCAPGRRGCERDRPCRRGLKRWAMQIRQRAGQIRMEGRADVNMDQWFAVLRTEDEMNEDSGKGLRQCDELRPFRACCLLLIHSRGAAPG